MSVTVSAQTILNLNAYSGLYTWDTNIFSYLSCNYSYPNYNILNYINIV